MNDYPSMESEDIQDFGEAMKQFFEVEFRYEKWNDSGHTKTTSTTCMSDDYDEDIDEMIETEDEPTYLIDTHSFGPPMPFSQGPLTSRQRSREWSTLGEEPLSLASFFDEPIDIPEICMSLDPPSQTPTYNYSVFDHNCCEMAPTMFDDSSEQVELPLPTPINLSAIPPPQELSHGYGESKLNSQRKFCAPNLVGELNFDTFHVSRPVSSIHFLGKLSSPTEHPLAERVKSGIRKPKDKMQCPSKKQAIDSMRMCPDLDKSNSSNVTSGQGKKWCRRMEPLEKGYFESADNDVLFGRGGLSNRHPGNICTSKKQVSHDPMVTFSNLDNSNCAKVASSLGQKRCRRIEPLEKEYVEITDNDVLLGRGGLSNRHPGNIVYRQHILEHQREYKLLKTDEKTEMSMDVVAWVKRRGGRFLKRDENAPGMPYYIATDVTARQKVSQALREDHTPEGRQQKKSRTKAYQS